MNQGSLKDGNNDNDESNTPVIVSRKYNGYIKKKASNSVRVYR